MPRFLLALLPLVVVAHAVADEPTFHGRTLAEWQARLRKGTSLERGRAATALGLGPFGKKAVPPLLEALQEKDSHLRRCVFIALGNLGPDAEAALPTLARHLNDKEEEHLSPVCDVLAKI